MRVSEGFTALRFSSATERSVVHPTPAGRPFAFYGLVSARTGSGSERAAAIAGLSTVRTETA